MEHHEWDLPGAVIVGRVALTQGCEQPTLPVPGSYNGIQRLLYATSYFPLKKSP